MGQRTAILVKRNFKDGTSETRLIHYQWGFGKTMVAHFMQEFLKSQYNYNSYDKGLKHYFKFDTRKYATYKKSKKDINVWDIETVQKWFDITDNNNGGMVVEITEEDSKYSFRLQDVKIGFLLGDEECEYNWDKQEYVNEKPFERFVSSNEYMYRTGGETYCPKMFRLSFNGFCETFGIKEIVKDNFENTLDK